MKVGFIGVGDQGEPMAQRILDAGFDLAVFARRPVQAERLVAAGARALSSVAELAGDCELLAVCVGTDAQVEEVCAAAVPNMRPGSLLAIHSTVDPETCIRVGESAREYGIRVIDAPVSGGRQRAFDGKLTVMVGGDSTDVESARAVFETFGSLIVHVGRLGSGEVLKLANNYLFAAQVAVTRDAVALVEGLGLDVAQSMQAIAASTGSSRAIEFFVNAGSDNVFPRHTEGRTHGASLLAKDIGLVNSVSARTGATLPADLDYLVGTGVRIAVDSGVADDAREAIAART